MVPLNFNNQKHLQPWLQHGWLRRQKKSGLGGVRWGHGEGLSVGIEEILANRPAPQEGEAVSGALPTLFSKGCPLSPVLFIILMDRISRQGQVLEGVQFGVHTISSLLFADDVVLLALVQTGTFVMHWDGLQLSVKRLGWQSAPPSPRP